MKKIVLRSLHLLGWRGEKERLTHFSPIETTISGANGLGKSRHFDAFLWLLFGKDSLDRKDYELKSRDANGETTPKAPCEVSAILEVDGKPLKLRRAYIEEWVKPRGKAEEVFKGHHTDCWWDDVPVSVSEYSKRISSIIDETTFKLLTSPAYFPSLPWEKQRAILFDIANIPTIEDVARDKIEWLDLMDKLEGKSLADFRKVLSARKKRLQEELDKIQPKIDQTRCLLPPWQDRKTIEPELAAIEERLSEIEAAMTSHAEELRQRDNKAQERQAAIQQLRSKQGTLVDEERRRADEETYQQGKGRRDAQHAVAEAQAALNQQADIKKRTEARLRYQVEEVAALSEKIRGKRNEWIALHEATYSGDTTCPCCGQPLPEAKQEEALKLWRSDKQARLDAIGNEGARLAQLHNEKQQGIEALELALAECTAKEAELRAELQQCQDALAALPEAVKVEPRSPEELPGYSEIEAQVQALLSEADADAHTDSSEAFTAERRKLSARRDELRSLLAQQDQWDDFSARIKELELKGKELSQQIADAEREEFDARALSIRQVELCEQSINDYFQGGVTFKLFAYTIEDKLKESPIETCQILVDGVPYGSANNARQVSAGLEIIRTLSEHNDISAPVFIDNRESVQQLPEDLPYQIINLRVSDDKELVITHNR